MVIVLDYLVQFIGTLSIMVAVASALVGGLLLLVSVNGGWSFPLSGTTYLEGFAVLGAGNLVCLVLNLAILVLRRWSLDLDWLRLFILRFQVAPAMLTLVAALVYLELERRDSVAQRQYESISRIAQGKADAVAALVSCDTPRCMRWFSADDQLLLAAEYDRLDWAQMARDRGGRLSRGGYRTATRSTPLHCENDIVVAYPDALTLALVHDNAALVNLLVPLTDERAGLSALYTAASLGRESGVKRLLAALDLTELPAGLERFSAVSGGSDTTRILPSRPLVCQLPSWKQLGFAPEGD